MHNEPDSPSTLVLVEDDPLLGAILVDILESEGYTCSLFGTADDALVWMLKHGDSARLIISDHGTPGQLTGAELSVLVFSKWPLVPFILMSGHELASIKDVDAHVRWLAKPWGVTTLLTLVHQVLEPATLQ